MANENFILTKFAKIKQILLVNPDTILLLSLHIKLGLMKKFVKAFNKEGQYSEYLQQKFTHISGAKVHEGVFDNTQLRKMLNDQNCNKVMNEKEKAA